MNKLVLLLLIVCLLLNLLSGCSSNSTTASSEQEPTEIIAKTMPSEIAEPSSRPIQVRLEAYSIIEQWKPNNKPNGFGAVILLNRDYSEVELIELIKSLATNHDPVLIRIFTSREAYHQEKSGSYGPEYDRDYILFYVKNLTGSGAYRGFNEIRWMQVSGKFASKAGTKTKLY